MQLLIDSAQINEIQQAAQWGWVSGATTNPTLLAASDRSAAETLKTMKKLLDGPIFYQLTAATIKKMKKEAEQTSKILGNHLVLKIPATPLGFEAAASLSANYVCAITSIFTPAQALTAHAAGARYALYYHNRAKRLLKKGGELAETLVRVLKKTGTQVIAASLKSPEELVEARLAGVPILSAKFSVLVALPSHDLSEAALEEFRLNGIGLSTKN